MQTTAVKVDTCGEAGASTVSLFPTTSEPLGVLRLTLTSANARCTVNKVGAEVATSGYQVIVEYANPTAPTGYTQEIISRTSGTLVADPLPGLLNKPMGGGRVIGDYVDAWSLSPPSASTTSTTASASVPGALKLISQPLRNLADGLGPDPASAVSLTLGAVGCSAEDTR
jgi:hypothetical protein